MVMIKSRYHIPAFRFSAGAFEKSGCQNSTAAEKNEREGDTAGNEESSFKASVQIFAIIIIKLPFSCPTGNKLKFVGLASEDSTIES
jgi:hypothetical protein